MKRYITLALAMASTAAIAHSDVKDPNVQKRMAGMKEMAAQMKTLGAMSKGQSAFDASAANAALDAISTQATSIPALFEVEANDPQSEALPRIWTDHVTFINHAARLNETAETLTGTVQQKNDLGRAIKQLGQSCRGCHETFKE